MSDVGKGPLFERGASRYAVNRGTGNSKFGVAEMATVRWKLARPLARRRPTFGLVFVVAIVFSATAIMSAVAAPQNVNSPLSSSDAIKRGKHAFKAAKFGEAAAWFKSAVERSGGQAEFALAILYSDGLGVAKDPSEARRLWLASAYQGFGPGMTAVGDTYLHGLGVEKNPAEALRWYKVAAETGRPHEMYHLGTLYEKGDSAPLDLAEAVHWYNLAARKGDPDARAALARLGEPSVPVDVARSALPFPARAAKEKVTGRVKLSCPTTVAGTLVDCTILEESPQGYGFGYYAIDLAMRKFRIRPEIQDGIPIASGPVIVPVTMPPR
jgi:hypothetical protein